MYNKYITKLVQIGINNYPGKQQSITVDGIWGPITESCYQAIVSMENEKDAPRWLVIARGELGVAEIAGDKHNDRIVAYHKVTASGESPDEVPWCSSFMCWVFERSGIESPRSKRARSWLDWGIEIEKPIPGCVVVLSRGKNPAKGHVMLWDHENDNYIYGLGGNQKNTVSIEPYGKGRLLSYRWPNLN